MSRTASETRPPKRTRSDERLPLYPADAPHSRGRDSKEWRFVRLLYNWLAIFAFWGPWKRFILQLYSKLATDVGPVVLLPFQIVLALALTLALALFSALLHQALTKCCGAFERGADSHAYDELPADRLGADSYDGADRDDDDAAGGNPFV